jgi:hypothetical protein
MSMHLHLQRAISTSVETTKLEIAETYAIFGQASDQKVLGVGRGAVTGGARGPLAPHSKQWGARQ